MLFVLCSSALAQQPKNFARIGYLSPLDARREADRAEVIHSALRDLSYIEGQNIALEFRYAEGNRHRQAIIAAELVQLNVDVIVVAGGEPIIRAAKNATQTIPIVMTGSGPDPVAAGLVQSFARPGGNITGLTYRSTELGGKRLELLKEAFNNSIVSRFFTTGMPRARPVRSQRIFRLPRVS
jgi:putative tryptophan/tyrosine transport system substrate-binding protein